MNFCTWPVLEWFIHCGRSDGLANLSNAPEITGPSAPIPEPSAILFLLIGLAAIWTVTHWHDRKSEQRQSQFGRREIEHSSLRWYDED